MCTTRAQHGDTLVLQQYAVLLAVRSTACCACSLVQANAVNIAVLAFLLVAVAVILRSRPRSEATTSLRYLMVSQLCAGACEKIPTSK